MAFQSTPCLKLRTLRCGLTVSHPKSAQTCRDPWSAGGQLHAFVVPRSLSSQAPHPLSTHSFSHLSVVVRLSWPLCAPRKKAQQALGSAGTLGTCTRRTHFWGHVHEGQAYPPFFFFKIPHAPQVLLLLT